jgi:hypothetical protein
MSDELDASEGWGEDVAAFAPSWNFEKDGSVLVGRIIEQDSAEVEGIGGEVREVPKFLLVTDDGERFNVWGSAVLSRVLPKHIGHRVRIEDKGTEEMGGGQSFRYFDVRCSDHTSAPSV